MSRIPKTTSPPPPLCAECSTRDSPPTLPLTVWYRTRPHPVVGERFVVGRSAQTCDLVIDDPRVAPQHMMIERVGDSYDAVDMGSATGTYYGGHQVTRKRILHGDSFHLLDHELRITR